MNTTHDIDTASVATAQLLPITDLKTLAVVVFDMATTQVMLAKAANELQLKVECAKKAYDEATATLVEQNKQRLASVKSYCEENKDLLFPLTPKGRKKTFKVLQHELKFRESTFVEAPDNIVELLNETIAHLSGRSHAAAAAGNREEANQLQEDARRLRAFLRQPPEELNKETVGAADDGMKDYLSEHFNIQERTEDSFSVVFKLTPETPSQKKAAKTKAAHKEAA